jgi:spore germination protein KC
MGQETVQTGGAAVIKNGKFIGWLSQFETRGLNILLNQIILTNYEVDCPLHPEETIVVGADSFRTHYRLNEVDGQTVVQIKVRGQFETVEFTEAHGPLARNQVEMEKAVSDRIKAELDATIRRAQELGADILGIGRYLQAHRPELWRRMKHNWEREFSAFPISIEVEMKWALTIRRLSG